MEVLDFILSEYDNRHSEFSELDDLLDSYDPMVAPPAPIPFQSLHGSANYYNIAPPPPPPPLPIGAKIMREKSSQSFYVDHHQSTYMVPPRPPPFPPSHASSAVGGQQSLSPPDTWQVGSDARGEEGGGGRCDMSSLARLDEILLMSSDGGGGSIASPPLPLPGSREGNRGVGPTPRGERGEDEVAVKGAEDFNELLERELMKEKGREKENERERERSGVGRTFLRKGARGGYDPLRARKVGETAAAAGPKGVVEVEDNILRECSPNGDISGNSGWNGANTKASRGENPFVEVELREFQELENQIMRDVGTRSSSSRPLVAARSAKKLSQPLKENVSGISSNVHVVHPLPSQSKRGHSAAARVKCAVVSPPPPPATTSTAATTSNGSLQALENELSAKLDLLDKCKERHKLHVSTLPRLEVLCRQEEDDMSRARVDFNEWLERESGELADLASVEGRRVRRHLTNYENQMAAKSAVPTKREKQQMDELKSVIAKMEADALKCEKTFKTLERRHKSRIEVLKNNYSDLQSQYSHLMAVVQEEEEEEEGGAHVESGSADINGAGEGEGDGGVPVEGEGGEGEGGRTTLDSNIIISKREKDGKVEMVYADGRKIIKFRNETVKEFLLDGSSIVRFVNGDVKHTHSQSGNVVYYYAEAQTTHTTYADRMELFEFPNGQKEKHFVDGSKEILFGDGTVKYIHADGSEESIFTDGTRIIDLPSGERRIENATVNNATL